MSKSDTVLIIFACFLIAAITFSYLFQPSGEVGSQQLSRQSGRSRTFSTVVSIRNDNYDSWRPVKLTKRLHSVDQQDTDLIEHIRENWILPPPTRSPRHLIHPEKYDYSEHGQSFVIDKIMKGKDGGFYVDAWAGTGETESNTLFLEKDRHWNGLLIEPNPECFRQLLNKRRSAYLLNACVSPSPYPSLFNLTFDSDGTEYSTMVQCFPLYSILAALGVYKVDYLSLRTEGMEEDILDTLPLDEDLDINAMTVRTYIYKDRRGTAAKIANVKRTLSNLGYSWIDAGEKINRGDTIMSKIKLTA